VKLEIELNIAADAAVMAGLQEHLRKEAILALFAGRKIPAGKAAQELGLTRIAVLGSVEAARNPLRRLHGGRLGVGRPGHR